MKRTASVSIISVILMVAFISAFSLHANAQLVIVQKAVKNGNSANPGISQSFSSPVTAGDALIVVTTLDDNGADSIVSAATPTDTLANTWKKIVDLSDEPTHTVETAIFATNGTSSGVDSVSQLWSGTANGQFYMTIAIYEINGKIVTNGTNDAFNALCGGSTQATVTHGDLTLSGVAQKGALGGTGSLSFTGIIDVRDDFQPNISASGRNPGTWQGTFPCVDIVFGLYAEASFNLVQVTTTVTAWNVPDGNGLISGTEFLLALLVPTGLMLGLSLKTKNPDSFVLIMLLGLMIGSIVGVIANLLPFALVFLFGAFLAIYIWRGRSSKGARGGGLPEVT